MTKGSGTQSGISAAKNKFCGTVRQPGVPRRYRNGLLHDQISILVEECPAFFGKDAHDRYLR